MAAKRQRGWSFIQVPEGDDGKGSLWAGELRAVCAEADSRWLYRGRASATVFDGLCRDYHVSFVLSLADGSAAVRATFERVLSATAAFSLVAGELFITNVQRLGASVYNVGLAIEPCEQFFALRQTLADAAGGSVGYGRAGHVSLLYVHVSHLDAATAFVDKHRRRFAGRQLLVDRVHLQLGGSALPVQLRGVSQWEKPAELRSGAEAVVEECPWREHVDAGRHGLRYYYNRVTGKSSWFMPDEYRAAVEQVGGGDRLPPRLQLTAEQQREVFFSLLSDAQAQPHERYLHVLVRLDDDPRLELVPAEQRLALFDDYCRWRRQQQQLADEEQHQQQQQQQQQGGFHAQKYRYVALLKQLVDDGQLDTRMSWAEAAPRCDEGDFSEPLEREFLFEETMMIVHTQRKQEEETRAASLLRQLRAVLQDDRSLDAATVLWHDYEQQLRQRHPWVDGLSLADRLGAFRRHMLQLEEQDARRRDQQLRAQQQRARQQRAAFKAQLAADYAAGRLGAFSTWPAYHAAVARALPYYHDSVGQPGSDMRDLFNDFVDDCQRAYSARAHRDLDARWQRAVDQLGSADDVDRLVELVRSHIDPADPMLADGSFRTYCEYRRQAADTRSPVVWIYQPADHTFILRRRQQPLNTPANTANTVDVEDGEIAPNRLRFS